MTHMSSNRMTTGRSGTPRRPVHRIHRTSNPPWSRHDRNDRRGRDRTLSPVSTRETLHIRVRYRSLRTQKEHTEVKQVQPVILLIAWF